MRVLLERISREKFRRAKARCNRLLRRVQRCARNHAAIAGQRRFRAARAMVNTSRERPASWPARTSSFNPKAGSKTRLRRVVVVLRPFHAEVAGIGWRFLRVLVQDIETMRRAPQTTFHDGEIRRIAARVAAEFAASKERVVTLRRCGESAIFTEQVHDHRVRCAECAHQIEIARASLRIARWRRCEQGRRMFERCAARMQVDHDIGARQQFGFNVMRDHLGRLAMTGAGKQPVEIAAVDGRGARAVDERRKIEPRNHDQPAANRQRRHALHRASSAPRGLRIRHRDCRR